MGEPVFNKKKRYVNKEGHKFGNGIWQDSNGKVIYPGQGFLTKDNKVVQYNIDGTTTTFTRSQWQDRKTREHELKVLQNDRKYGIPYIPSKKVTISIDSKSPTRNNAGATFSENLLDSIAYNASKARIPFSTALGIVSQESTLGHNLERTVGKSLQPWLYILDEGHDKFKKAADKISYKNIQSPSLLVSNWTGISDNPFAAYQYDNQGDPINAPRSNEYYDKDFRASLRKSNNYQMKDVSPLFSAFRKYKKNPNSYNPGDPKYPSKVEDQREELTKYSPEIRSYMAKRNLHSDGGYLNNDWNSLSYADKADMMKVAITNGITTLPEIRNAYNEFAKGGKTNWTIEDESKYRYWRSKLPKNLRETNDNDYDMRAAYKAGMQPMWNNEDKSYHLGSRDPNTGRIQKAPHHPTFLKALITDASLGYYPIMDKNGHVYTETWKGNAYAKGGYKPSSKIQRDIATWEGSEMKRNRPFNEMTQQFNTVVPKELQSRLSPNQLDALYSYGYNVGMGKLKERVMPMLNAYVNGKATNEDVQKSMWATKDSQLRGLARRRSWERDMFGGEYRAPFSKSKGDPVNVNNLGLSQAFFDGINNDIMNINVPQMPMPDNMNVDPSTLYKAPSIDDTLFTAPKPTVDEVYNPRQEAMNNFKRFNMVMGMMGERTPFSGLIGDESSGMLSYINGIYS